VKAKGFLARRKPYLTAHRGGALLAPENTLVAFEQAARLGADVFELDVRLTRDGEVVVFHDDDTGRITGAPGTVEERTLEELRRLDAGWSFVDAQGERPWRGRGVTIPTLREVVERHPRVLVNVEAKHTAPALAEALARVVLETGRPGDFCVGSFDDGQSERLRALLPGACHFLPENAATCHVMAARSGEGAHGCPEGYDVADLPLRTGGFTVVDATTVAYFHARGMQVHVWTVDDEGDMRALVALGVDGVMSDRPDLLARVLGRAPGG
jgi:glycerophosphoryl diester phosphodiesterase